MLVSSHIKIKLKRNAYSNKSIKRYIYIYIYIEGQKCISQFQRSLVEVLKKQKLYQGVSQAQYVEKLTPC